MLRKVFNYLAEDAVKHGPVQIFSLSGPHEDLTLKNYFLGAEPTGGTHLSSPDTHKRVGILTDRVLSLSGTATAAFLRYASPAYIAVPVFAVTYAGIKATSYFAGKTAGHAVDWADKKIKERWVNEMNARSAMYRDSQDDQNKPNI